jgi:peptidoglycan/xylan/chitin deacetylase (PgdA/CDA1 family)
MPDRIEPRLALAAVLALTPLACAGAPHAAAPRVSAPRVSAPRVSAPRVDQTPTGATMATSDAPPLREVAATATEATPRERVRAVVLLYHMLNGLEDEMAITPAAFREQMDWLVAHQIPVVATSDLVGFLEGNRALPERAAVIQLDDGHASAYAAAYPILKRRKLPFTVAINTAAMEGGYPNTMSWGSVREMMASGLCEVASHSHIHGHMDRLTNARNQSEATLSASIIEARTGVRPDAFVFPFGAHNERVRRTVEGAGYRAAFEVGGVAARASSPRFRVPRVTITRSMTLTNFAKLFGDRGSVAGALPTTSANRG